MPDLDLDVIEKLAREVTAIADKATPGPWTYKPNGRRSVVRPDGREVRTVCSCLSANEQDVADWQFLAAARADVPALAERVLALIARVRELERAVSALKQDFPGGVVTVQTGLPVDDGDPLLVAVAAERKRCAGTVGGAYSDTTE